VVSHPATPIHGLRDAQQRWAALAIDERLRVVRRVRALLAQDAGQLARASAAARGRDPGEALTAEVLPLLAACRFLEKNAGRILRAKRFGWFGRPLWLTGMRSEIRREPLGVILIIGPGNYPLLLPGVQMIQALVAGNAVILKPGVGGRAVAGLWIELLHRAGIERGLIQLLPESVGAGVAAIDAGPDKVLFTGSAAVASNVLAQLAPRMIPAVIEASGSDAAILCTDADPELCLNALVFALTFNAGATCMAPKRILIHRDLLPSFRLRLIAALAATQASPPIQLGPRLRELVDQAIDTGARVLTAAPLLLEHVAPDSPLWREDLFGAIALVGSFASDAEAAALANDCPYALSASVFSRSQARANRLASELSVGVVTLNDVIVSTADPRLSFGGRRRSGFGATRGAEGLLELTSAKAITRTRGRQRRAYQSVSASDFRWLLRFMRLAHGMGLRQRLGHTREK
jgi:acyl-CoA reductase-like NAD-dependent aldehyde dehydrogenase